MHKISICCIVKNEDDLLEWALYHKLIGFDHIYIYDNNDSPIDREETCSIDNGGLIQLFWNGLEILHEEKD